MSKLIRTTAVLAGLPVAALALTSCSFSASAGKTVEIEPAKLADQAAGALEAQVGRKPQIDCGTEKVKIEDGGTKVCELTDGGKKYDATITFSQVDKSTGKFHLDVKVANTPK